MFCQVLTPGPLLKFVSLDGLELDVVRDRHIGGGVLSSDVGLLLVQAS